jgi:hypothetical protein
MLAPLVPQLRLSFTPTGEAQPTRCRLPQELPAPGARARPGSCAEAVLALSPPPFRNALALAGTSHRPNSVGPGRMPNSILLERQVDAVVEDARRRQSERRLIAAIVILAAVVGTWSVWHFSTAGGSGGTAHAASITPLPLPNTGRTGPRSVTDGVLRVRVPYGGTGSINPGFQGGRPVAWILVGNFRFPADWGAQHREGTPTVPSDGILVTVGDFIPAAYSSDWPSARRLHLPSSSTASQVVSWNVRFAGRALRLSVHFGSVPDQGRRALANALLAGIRRV